MIDAIHQSRLRDVREQFGLSDFSTTRNDWIGQVFPHHCEEATDHPISVALEHDRPPDMDHCIAAARQPIDVGHVVELDGHHWVARESKSLWDVAFECRTLGQKACADECLSRTLRWIGLRFGSHLPGAGSWSEMRRHPIDSSRLESIRHRSLLVTIPQVSPALSRRMLPGFHRAGGLTRS